MRESAKSAKSRIGPYGLVQSVRQVHNTHKGVVRTWSPRTPWTNGEPNHRGGRGSRGPLEVRDHLQAFVALTRNKIARSGDSLNHHGLATRPPRFQKVEFVRPPLQPPPGWADFSGQNPARPPNGSSLFARTKGGCSRVAGRGNQFQERATMTRTKTKTDKMTGQKKLPRLHILPRDPRPRQLAEPSTIRHRRGKP